MIDMRHTRTPWFLASAVAIAGIALWIVASGHSPPAQDGVYDTFRDPGAEQRLLLAQLRKRVERYRAAYGRWPVDLAAAVSDTAPGPAARYLVVDMWGGTVSYRLRGAGFELRSAGPDRVMESEDDIVDSPAPEPARTSSRAG